MMSETRPTTVLTVFWSKATGFMSTEKARAGDVKEMNMIKTTSNIAMLFLYFRIIDEVIIPYFINLLYNYRMRLITIILGYLGWHYSGAISALTNIWKNFLFFVFEFFSIRLLFRNFFDPWKKMADSYPKSFDLKKYFYAFIANLIVRTVGIIMRTALIIIGIICYLLTAILYPITLIGWLLLPIITVLILIIGILLII